MLVADTLLIDTDSLDRENLLVLRQPLRIELIVGHEEEEDDAHQCREEAGSEEQDAPALDGRFFRVHRFGDAERQETTEDLRPAVEAEPDTDAGALFATGVPL